jgi:hypothetical protein
VQFWPCQLQKKQATVPRFPLLIELLAIASLSSSQAQAQQSKQQLLVPIMPPALAVTAVRAKTIVLIGRVETTTGVLPGAVLEAKSNKNLRAVMDIDADVFLLDSAHHDKPRSRDS